MTFQRNGMSVIRNRIRYNIHKWGNLLNRWCSVEKDPELQDDIVGHQKKRKKKTEAKCLCIHTYQYSHNSVLQDVLFLYCFIKIKLSNNKKTKIFRMIVYFVSFKRISRREFVWWLHFLRENQAPNFLLFSWLPSSRSPHSIGCLLEHQSPHPYSKLQRWGGSSHQTFVLYDC